MSLTFTDDEKATISRRQVNIITENDGFNSTIATFTDDEEKLLKVDDANNKFYSYYDNHVIQYETESRQIDGKVAATYLTSDITSAAQTPANVLFFPISGTAAYTQLIPLISDSPFTNNTVKGRFHPTSTDAQSEETLLSNPTDTVNGLTELIDYLENGITSGSPASVSSTGSVPAGVTLSTTLTVTATAGFASTQKVYLTNTTHSGIYEIVSLVLNTSITVKSLLPTLVGMTNPNIDNNVAGFNSTERQNLTSTSYQELLTNLTNQITTTIANWETKLNNQITALNLNDDERLTQQTENAVAKVDAQNSISIIDVWQALPNTGVGARYTSTGISPISTEIIARQTFIATRITQIEVALGTNTFQALTQSGSTFTATDLTNRYYQRYKWLNARINRATGSLRRYYASFQGKNFIQQLKTDNNNILSDYNQYFTTKQIIFLDDTPIIQVTNTSGYSVGDQVYILSDKQVAIKKVIMAIMGTNQIKLDSPIPNTYQVLDLSRIYKEL
jgi:hypothetical protein